MKIIYKILILVFLMLNSFNIFSQHKEKIIELKCLEVKNEGLSLVLDSILTNEKKCTYFNNKLIFVINVKKLGKNSLLQIESIKDKNIAIDQNSYGYFNFKNHLFFVGGEFSYDLFTDSKKLKKFNYLDYDPRYQENNSNVVITVFTDDSFSQWEFIFVKGQFILKSKSTNCEKGGNGAK
jgi:hypothetical protein